MSLYGKSNEVNEVLLNEGDGFMSAETLTKCKNSVCLIRCETQLPKPKLKRGTGFYVTARVFGIQYYCIVTNHHVLSCEEDAKVAYAIFGFEGKNPGVMVQLRPDKIFQTNEYLDYTAVGVDEEALKRIYPNRVFPLDYVEQPEASIGDDIFIFQHPKGSAKQFSYEKIIAIKPPFVYYNADTDEGSSGSPVLRKLRLMAVHHKGSTEKSYNKGTLFSEIIQDLHSGYAVSGKPVSTDESMEEMEENSCEWICVENSNGKPVQCGLGLPGGDQKFVCPDDEVLDKLSHECSGFYKHLGRRLQVENAKIEDISKDHINYGSNIEKCFQVLQECKESEVYPLTYGNLEKALRSLKRNNLANKYCCKEQKR